MDTLPRKDAMTQRAQSTTRVDGTKTSTFERVTKQPLRLLTKFGGAQLTERSGLRRERRARVAVSSAPAPALACFTRVEKCERRLPHSHSALRCEAGYIRGAPRPASIDPGISNG